jgi:hypothetical protein
MASTISDFNLRVKKMSPDIAIATDSGTEKDYNLAKTNPYKRQITFNSNNLTGSNQILSFQLDTQTIYSDNKCAWTFCDLRVYDTDGVTPLSFWVEAPNTPYTTIFVKFPTLSSGNKVIYIEYGNPALENIADLGGTCGAIFESSVLRAWFKANEANRVTKGGLYDNYLAKLRY